MENRLKTIIANFLGRLGRRLQLQQMTTSSMFAVRARQDTVLRYLSEVPGNVPCSHVEEEKSQHHQSKVPRSGQSLSYTDLLRARYGCRCGGEDRGPYSGPRSRNWPITVALKPNLASRDRGNLLTLQLHGVGKESLDRITPFLVLIKEFDLLKRRLQKGPMKPSRQTFPDSPLRVISQCPRPHEPSLFSLSLLFPPSPTHHTP
jgi:hypothetical protein